ncbi:YraN family protein [Rothia kristinae]
MDERAQTGRWGEQIAAAVMIGRGWEVLARNWRPPAGAQAERGEPARGELDLILRAPEGYVICEVKTRTTADCGHPFEAIDEQKIRSLRRLTGEWTRGCGLRPGPVRIDAVAITGTPTGFTYEQLEGVG